MSESLFCVEMCGRRVSGEHARCLICEGRKAMREHPDEPRRKHTREMRLELASLYRAGATLEEIGKEIGVTRERVRQLISSVSVERNRSQGSRRQTLGESRRAVRRSTSADSEERHIVSLMRQGWRERLVVRVIQELAEDLGYPPRQGDVWVALCGTDVPLTKRIPNLWSYLTTADNLKREPWKALSTRLWARAGVAVRGAGGKGHLVPFPRRQVCKHGHADWVVYGGKRMCRPCSNARRLRHYHANKARAAVTVGRFTVDVA